MKIIIGANPDDSGSDALALGSLLCKSLQAQPVLAHIAPAAYNVPGPGNIDHEWRVYLRGEAAKVLDEARAKMHDLYGWSDVRTIVGEHRSSGQGLADVAAAENADMIVIGSAPGARSDSFAIGSTADKLLHGSPVPVAVAPSRYRVHAPESFGRIIVGFRNTPEAVQALQKAAEYAETAGKPLVALTILIRSRMHGSKLGASAEDAVMESLRDQIDEARATALEGIDLSVATLTAVADTPGAALQRIEWRGDELLILGSARGGPLTRVFLGDMTYRILRSTPVPAVVLPRHHD